MKLKDYVKRVKHQKHLLSHVDETPVVPPEEIIEVNGKKFVKVKLLIDHTADDYIQILEQMVSQLQKRIKGSAPKAKFEKQITDMQKLNVYLKHELSHLSDRYINQKNTLQDFITENEELHKRLLHLSRVLYEKEELLKQALEKNKNLGLENTELKLNLFKRTNATKVRKSAF